MNLNGRGEMLCVWSGYLGITIFLIAWVGFMGWLFPPSPSLSAEQITKVYLDNAVGIRVAVSLIVNFAAPLTIVFTALITIYMLRMKGPSPVLAVINIAASAIQVPVFQIPAELYAASAYRLDRMPEITQFGNDVGWFIFDNIVGPTQVQYVAIGLAILWDKSEKPLLPRWFGFFCFWAATIMLLNNMILFFKDGPFAWNGLLGWWPGAGVFCLWYYVAAYVMHQAVKKNRIP